jgi:tetratricopeptide (TPR) repeat protein
MKTRLTGFALVVAALLAQAAEGSPIDSRSLAPFDSHPLAQGRQGGQDPVWLQRLQRWLQAIERHQPGSNDEEARAVATWPRSDLKTLQSDLLALRDALRRGYGEAGAPLESRVATYRDQRFTMPALQQMLGLSEDEARRGEIDRILWAGAVLHSDIAMLVPSEDRPVVGRAIALRVRDGQPDGYEYPVSVQWEFARDLLGALRPDPERDEAIALWYKATGAYLVASGVLWDAVAQLDRGRQLFPGDADLLFLSGCVHEAYAAPSLQEVAALLVPPPGHTITLGSSRSHLTQAERDFAKALEKNGRLTEARLRLGHVLGLLGRHQEAADQLRQAASTVGDSQVLYYACMFLGEEEQALGHRDAAHDWYDRAATLYPRAQSPLFALSNLASAFGDMTGARRAADRIRGLPADENERVDPWLAYHAAGGRDAATLWRNLMAAVLPDGKR